MPGGPRTVKSRQLCSSTARSNACAQHGRARRRARRAAGRAGARGSAPRRSTSSTRRRPTSSSLPFTEIRSSGPALTACSTSGYVAFPMMISPAAAPCSSRLATITGSPATSPRLCVGVAGEHLAGVDPDPRLQAELGQRVLHLLRCPHGSERVVLVHGGDAEHRHHLVADELLDRPAVPLDDLAHAIEEARLHAPVRLGVPLREPGGVDEVAKEDRDGLPHFSCGHAHAVECRTVRCRSTNVRRRTRCRRSCGTRRCGRFRRRRSS